MNSNDECSTAAPTDVIYTHVGHYLNDNYDSSSQSAPINGKKSSAITVTNKNGVEVVVQRYKLEQHLSDFTSTLYDRILESAGNDDDDDDGIPEKWLFGDAYDPTARKKDISNALTTMNIYFTQYVGVVYLLTFQQYVQEKYIIDSSFQSYNTIRPPSQVTVDIDLDKTEKLWDEGLFYCINKENGNRVMLYLHEKGIEIQSLKETGESDAFNEGYLASLETNDIFRNKTFTFTPRLMPKFIAHSGVKRNAVVLPDDIWKQLEINVINVFRKNEQYKKRNIPTKRGVILEGPPGNGKSMVVKYLEEELRGEVTFMYVTDGLVSSGGAIGAIFDLAQRYSPCVLIFEDVDSIGASRDMGGRSITPELLSRLDGLEQLDDFVIVATTNYPERIDDALRNRPNRFDRRIKIRIPQTPELRLGLLKKFLADKNEDKFSDEELLPVATSLANFSGAQINEVVVTAQMLALHDKIELDIPSLQTSVEFMKENYYDDQNIGKSADKKAGFRSK